MYTKRVSSLYLFALIVLIAQPFSLSLAGLSESHIQIQYKVWS